MIRKRLAAESRLDAIENLFGNPKHRYGNQRAHDTTRHSAGNHCRAGTPNDLEQSAGYCVELECARAIHPKISFRDRWHRLLRISRTSGIHKRDATPVGAKWTTGTTKVFRLAVCSVINLTIFLGQRETFELSVRVCSR